jgi:PRP1 splicing factor, N-terminal
MTLTEKERERARDPDKDEGAGFNEINFDNWGGFQNVRLFQSTAYDEEDQEADETYATLDK